MTADKSSAKKGKPQSFYLTKRRSISTPNTAETNPSPPRSATGKASQKPPPLRPPHPPSHGQER